MTRRNIAKIFTAVAATCAITGILFAYLAIFAIYDQHQLFFLFSSFCFFLLTGKYIVDFNKNNKRNDVLWMSVTFITGIVMIAFFILEK